MHILYLHQYFTSRQGATGTRSYEFSRFLVERGHRVTLLTSGVDNPLLRIPAGRDHATIDCDGIRVVGLAAGYNDPKAGTALGGLQRMHRFHAFARAASRYGRQLPRPDLVLATHTPLPIGRAGLALQRHFRVPFVFEVRDLWPEALTDAGLLTNPLVIAWLRSLSRRIYRRADHLIALSPAMRDGILAYGIAAERISVIPNASDLDLFDPAADGSAWRRELGLGERFTALYCGAMGRANGLDYLLDAAQELQDRGRDDIVCVLLGDGGARPALQARVAAAGLDNVLFQEPRPRAETAQAVAGSQACLVVFRPSRSNAWSPNKFFDALAGGRPVVLNVPGWLGGLVAEHEAGLVTDPHDPSSLAEALTALADDPQRCVRLGAHARVLAEQQFDRRQLAARFEEVLVRTAAGGGHA